MDIQKLKSIAKICIFSSCSKYSKICLTPLILIIQVMKLQYLRKNLLHADYIYVVLVAATCSEEFKKQKLPEDNNRAIHVFLKS